MTRYLISFDDGAMTIPEEDLPAVGEAAHTVVKAAQDARVWIFGGGVVRADDSCGADGGEHEVELAGRNCLSSQARRC